MEGSRVSLDSLVYAFLRGESPEGIAQSFPALTLEQVFGALTFYLANQQTVDRYMQQGQEGFERMRQQARQTNPRLYAKLDSMRQKSPSPSE